MIELARLRQLTFARAATALVFFMNGFGHGSWAPRLAEIKALHGLSDGTLGLALFALALGALLAMPFAGALAARYGSARASLIGALCYGGLLPGMVLADGPMLAAAFLVFGMAVGGLDVVMNAQAVAIERGYGRSIMNGLHGMFSLGGMAGALVAGLVAGAGIGLAAHLLTMAVVIALLAGGACLAMLPAGLDPKGDAGPRMRLPDRSLLALGAIGFCALLSEGSVGDWSAVYLQTSLDAGTTTAAAAFAVFSITMALGRFCGDWLVDRVNPAMVLRAGGLLAASGLGLTLLLAQPIAAVLGYGLVGLGLSCSFPIALSASARVPGLAPGIAIAGVCTLGYFGLLAGPAGIGFLAELIGLPRALGLVVVLCAVIVLLAGRLPEVRQPAQPMRDGVST